MPDPRSTPEIIGRHLKSDSSLSSLTPPVLLSDSSPSPSPSSHSHSHSHHVFSPPLGLSYFDIHHHTISQLGTPSATTDVHLSVLTEELSQSSTYTLAIATSHAQQLEFKSKQHHHELPDLVLLQSRPCTSHPDEPPTLSVLGTQFQLTGVDESGSHAIFSNIHKSYFISASDATLSWCSNILNNKEKKKQLPKAIEEAQRQVEQAGKMIERDVSREEFHSDHDDMDSEDNSQRITIDQVGYLFWELHKLKAEYTRVLNFKPVPHPSDDLLCVTQSFHIPIGRPCRVAGTWIYVMYSDGSTGNIVTQNGADTPDIPCSYHIEMVRGVVTSHNIRSLTPQLPPFYMSSAAHRWSNNKTTNVKVSQDGAVASVSIGTLQWNTVIGDMILQPQSGIHQFQIVLESYNATNQWNVVLGVIPQHCTITDIDPNCPIGYSPSPGWSLVAGYLCTLHHSFAVAYGSAKQGDKIGLVWDSDTGRLCFYHNGVRVGSQYTVNEALIPAVTLYGDASVRIDSTSIL